MTRSSGVNVAGELSGQPVSPARPTPLPTAEQSLDLRALQRRRRHPRWTQFDYLHLRRLTEDIAATLADLPHPVDDVLDVFCGTRPYEDLLPAGARTVGLDIEDPYGVVDVVSREFLPFPDCSFDLVVCFQGFYYVADPVRGAAEIRRVLRPGGTAVITVPCAWEYDPTILEHRYTGPEMAALFEDWSNVQVIENGGRAVTWTSLTARLVQGIEWRAARAPRALFSLLYALLNGFGAVLDKAEDTRGVRSSSLPPNVLLRARRPRSKRRPRPASDG